ncbi:MAG: hypothetical protein ACOCSD_03565 [Halolamina sp.]
MRSLALVVVAALGLSIVGALALTDPTSPVVYVDGRGVGSWAALAGACLLAGLALWLGCVRAAR